MRFLPLTAIVLLGLAGCAQNPPSPEATLSCQQYRIVGDFEYLNCLRGYQAQSTAQPMTAAPPAR